MKAIIRYRYGNQIDTKFQDKVKPAKQEKSQTFRNGDSTDSNRLKNINDNSIDSTHVISIWDEKAESVSLNHKNDSEPSTVLELGPITTTTISFVSPSSNSLTTIGGVERVVAPLLPPVLTQPKSSVLLSAYQYQSQELDDV